MFGVREPFMDAIRVKDMSTYIGSTPSDRIGYLKGFQTDATRRRVRIRTVNGVCIVRHGSIQITQNESEVIGT
jgi:hypothetical protein